MNYRVNTQAELDKIIDSCREGDVIYLDKGDFFVEHIPPGITFVGKAANSTTLRKYFPCSPKPNLPGRHRRQRNPGQTPQTAYITRWGVRRL